MNMDNVDANPFATSDWGETAAVQCTEGQDEVDADPSGAGGKSDEPMEASSGIVSAFEYKMDYPKRGLFVIFNNKTFKKSTGMNSRSGTDVDAANLYQRFKELGFEVHMFNDKTKGEMMKVMSEASRYDHNSSAAFGCAILSHGDDGVVYGTDGIVKVDDLCAPFKGETCPGLAGKPKLFFIQACRGSELDHGVMYASDADDEEDSVNRQKIYRIPSEADFFYAYSTVPGYFSWRNSTKGSWFVQALNKVFKEHSKTRDLLWMMTRVNNMVAYDFESNAAKEFMNRKKQIPSVVSQLTKDVYFRPMK